MKQKKTDKSFLSTEKLVQNTYSQEAKKILNKGYRTTWWYIANKALSDWDLLSQIEIKDKEVLNIGCFEPIDELFFARLVKSWTAIDINQEGIKVAKEITDRELHPNLARKIKFLVADATKLPFSNEKFDIAVSFSAVEHIPDKKKREEAIGEMARVVKKGGYVVVTVPNKLSFFAIVHKRLMKAGISEYGYAHLYSKKELKEELLNVGLKPIYFASEMRIVSSTPFFLLRIISRFMQNFGDRIGFLAQKIN